MNRGDVWWINFDPALGGEVRKKRPAVLVGNDAANRHLNRLQVVPLTTSVGRLYPSEAMVTVRRRRHKPIGSPPWASSACSAGSGACPTPT